MHRLHGTLVSSRLDKEPEGGTVRKAACKKKKKRKKKKKEKRGRGEGGGGWGGGGGGGGGLEKNKR